jgi:hypothetical protein
MATSVRHAMVNESRDVMVTSVQHVQVPKAKNLAIVVHAVRHLLLPQNCRSVLLLNALSQNEFIAPPCSTRFLLNSVELQNVRSLVASKLFVMP